MPRPSSPAAHWDNLETWLRAMTTNFLPKVAGDSEPLSQEQLDADVDTLTARDPNQIYNYKDWAEIVGSLAFNLVAQARLSEKSNTDLKQEVAALKLQAKEARRNRALTQSHLDQLLLETEEEDETDTDRREQSEKETRKELNEKLRRGEALLERANTELKESDAKAKACAKHLQAALVEIHELAQQRHDLKYELDIVHRELKHSYRLQSDREGERNKTKFPLTSRSTPFSQEPRADQGGKSPLFKTAPTSLQEPPSAARGGNTFQRTLATNYCHVATKELDKLSRHIPTFSPDPAGGHDVHTYLRDIDFHLQTIANVNTFDILYLLRITSSRDVHNFLDRQQETVKTNYPQLRQALIREFSDAESDQGLFTAMDLKQARRETPQNYYGRLRQAYFGARNEPGMEEDVNFRILFLRNLHPTVSHHLGVLACPRSMPTQQLRDLAHKAFIKQRTVSKKTVKNPTSYSVSENCSELTLEGAQQHHSHRSFNRESRPFQATRGQHNRGGAQPKHQSKRPDRHWNHSRQATGKPKSYPTSTQHSAATSETAEILRMLKELLYMKTRKEDKKD